MTGARRAALAAAVLAALAPSSAAASEPSLRVARALPGSWLAADTITLTKTVAVDPTPGDSSGDTCSTTRAITVEPGTPVVYCYRVRNNSTSLVLTTHRVVDNRLGTILDDFPAPVGPGVSVFVTQEATIHQTTRNTATWTASNATASLADSDSATVTVRKSGLLELRTTVGVDPTPGDTSGDTCPTTYTISVPPGTPVIWCYRIRNTSATVTLHRHTIVDAELGTLAEDIPSTLGPGASLFLPHEGILERTTAKKATWTARNTDGTIVLTATAFRVATLPWCPGHASDPRNQVVGTALAETLVGTPGRDVICGGGGNDALRGLGGDDLQKGEAGTDRLVGGGGRDFLLGGAGRDTLVAKDGRRDVVDGGTGRDGARVDGRDAVRRVERLL